MIHDIGGIQARGEKSGCCLSAQAAIFVPSFLLKSSSTNAESEINYEYITSPVFRSISSHSSIGAHVPHGSNNHHKSAKSAEARQTERVDASCGKYNKTTPRDVQRKCLQRSFGISSAEEHHETARRGSCSKKDERVTNSDGTRCYTERGVDCRTQRRRIKETSHEVVGETGGNINFDSHYNSSSRLLRRESGRDCDDSCHDHLRDPSVPFNYTSQHQQQQLSKKQKQQQQQFQRQQRQQYIQNLGDCSIREQNRLGENSRPEKMDDTSKRNFRFIGDHGKQQGSCLDFEPSVSVISAPATDSSNPPDILRTSTDHFPCLTRIASHRNQKSDLRTIDAPVTYNCDIKSPALSYLALATKSPELTKEPEDYCRSINMRGESSWYFSNSTISKMVAASSTSESLDGGDIQDAIKVPFDALYDDSYNEVKVDPRNVLEQGVESFVIQSTMLARITPISSGSKSAAEKWKGRWLDIARQHSLLQKKRQAQQQEISRSDNHPVSSILQQQWHSVLSQGQGCELGQTVGGEEEPVPALYSYLNKGKQVASNEKHERLATILDSPSARIEIPETRTRTASKRVLKEYAELRWWTAVLVGDHSSLLKLLLEEKFNLDSCFCYVTYASDQKLAMHNREASTVSANIADVSFLLEDLVTCSSRSRVTSSYTYSCDDDGFTAIHMCAKLCHPVCLDHLLRSTSASGADARDRTFKRTPLHLACEAVDLECTRILLLHGADPECRDKLGDTALHKACNSNLAPTPSAQVALVSFLCDRSKSNNAANGGSLKVNTKNKKRETALMYARTRDLAVVLIGAGADPSLTSSEGLDAASMASRRGDAKVLEAILGCNSFRQSAVIPTNNSSTLSSRKIVGTINPGNFTTPLHEASKADSVSCIKILLSARYFNVMDLDRLDSPSHSTSLMLACAAGHARVVQELLSKGADIGVEDRRGVTALVIATRYGHTMCVRAITTARPGSPSKINSVGENVLEMLARILKQDLSYEKNSFGSDNVENFPSGLIELCIPIVAELIMQGAPMTDRFIRRFSSCEKLELFKSMKLSRHDFNPPSSYLHNNVRIEREIATITFEVDVSDSMWRTPQPDINLCDITFLLADDEKCKSHSFIVCSESAVLKAMLLSDMLSTSIDCDTGAATILISLPYHSKDTFSLLLQWMYEVRDVTDIFDLAISNHQAALLDLLYLANEYLIIPLQRLCEHRIGRNLGYFNKETLLSLCVSLNLRLLLAYYHRSYPVIIDSSSELSEISGIKSIQPGIDQCSISSVQRRIPVADFSAECLLSDTDLEWRTRLTTLPLEEHNLVDRPSEVSSSYNCGSSCESRDLSLSPPFDENGPVSWWLNTLIILASKEWWGKNHCLGSVDAVLSVAQSELTKWGKGTFLARDSVEQKTLIKLEKVFDFTYTAPANRTFGEVQVSSLSTLDPDSRLRCMLTDLRKRIVTVSIDPDPLMNHSSSQLKNVLPTAKSLYHTYRQNIIECEPFLGLNIEKFSSPEYLGFDVPIIFTPDIVERLKTRLADITPLCVVLQQQRAALLCKPESSLFDTIIVLVSPASNSANSRHIDEDESSSDSEEFWSTANNGQYLHCSGFHDDFLQGQEHQNILLVHKAFLTVGSGKLVAMMHFASAQGMRPCTFRCSKTREVTVLKVVLDDQEDAVRDFKDLIWFMYTGVLRGVPYATQTADDVESVDEALYQQKNDARLLRLLWLADEYLMTDLTNLLEHRMLKALSPSNASAFFLAATALGLKKLCLAAGICELYSIGATVDQNGKRTSEMFHAVPPSSSSISFESTFRFGPEVKGSNNRDAVCHDDEDDDSSTALVLQEILRSLAVSA